MSALVPEPPGAVNKVHAVNSVHWGLAIAGLAVVAYLIALLPPIQRFDIWVTDQQRFLSEVPQDFSDLLVVDVDEDSMTALQSELGSWPYDRQVYALVHKFLARSGVNAVGYDIVFSDPRDPAGDADFAKALSSGPPTALAAVVGGAAPLDSADFEQRLKTLTWTATGGGGQVVQSALLPLPHFSAAATPGTLTVEPDADGRLRRVPLSASIRGKAIPSLSVALIGLETGTHLLDYDASGDVARLGKRRLPLGPDQSIMPIYPSNLGELPVLPFYRLVLAALKVPEYQLSDDQLRGRTIFIGSTMAILGDYVYVPGHGRVPGLAVQSLVWHSLKHGNLYRPAPAWGGAALLILLLLPSAIAGRQFNASLIGGLLLTLAGLAAAIAVQWALFDIDARQLPLAPAIVGALLVLGLNVTLQFRREASERRRLEMEALAAQEANELKGRFLARMTHELRTPLTAIIGYNELLGGELDISTRANYSNVVDRSAQHLLGLINNILDQAKIEAGHMTLDPQPVNLRKLVSETVDLMEPLASKRKLSLKVDIAPGVPATVKLDPLRMRQIMINIIGNGLKFTATGGVKLDVLWSADRLDVVIRDTGPGIPAAVQKRLFTAFQQASASIAAEYGGTGLGLSISRNLARLMGGFIELESTVGEGSTFTVTVDAPEVEARAPAKVTALSVAVAGTVLLADDNPDNRNLIALYLRKLGLDATLAENGRVAVEEVARRPPDLVLMDLLMPEMDGLDATRALRKSGYSGPILALTAHSESREKNLALGAGCNEVLVKPISFENLRTALGRHLGPTAKAE